MAKRRERITTKPKPKKRAKKPAVRKATMPAVPVGESQELTPDERAVVADLARERAARRRLEASTHITPAPQPPKTFEKMDAMAVQTMCGSAPTDALRAIYSTAVATLGKLERIYRATPEQDVHDGEGGITHAPKATAALHACSYAASKLETLHDELHRRGVPVQLPPTFRRSDFGSMMTYDPEEAPQQAPPTDHFNDTPTVAHSGRHGARRREFA